MLSDRLKQELVSHFAALVQDEALQPCLRPMNGLRRTRVDRPAQDIAPIFGIAELRETPDVIVCYLTIDFGNANLTFAELQDIMASLDIYSAYEYSSFQRDDVRWTIGDGDDPTALNFYEGKFCIWLRGWKQ